MFHGPPAAPAPIFVTVTQTQTQTVHAAAPTVTVRASPEVPPLLNGPPTTAYKDNLRPELQYITTWPGSGFTQTAQMNLIYLGLLTERVPIITFFTPAHIWKGDPIWGPTIDFGQVFDVPRLSEALGKPVLEWWEVKDPTSKAVDPLGCWNVWQAVNKNNPGPHFNTAPRRLKLDISYTIAPRSIKLFPSLEHDTHMTYASLVALAFPAARNRALQSLPPPDVSPILKTSLAPDEHLLCFDNLYWASSADTHEIQRDFGPAWRFVGQYMHWAPQVEARAHEYLRAAFGLAPGDTIPPYITVHARRGDFAKWCRAPHEECLAPLAAYALRVDEVRAALFAARGVAVAHVVMTSDEAEPAWWDEVRARGWVAPDHALTGERYGKWGPVHIDGAIQSGSVGFVGTDQSTVSIVAGRRVTAWRGGVVRMVKWGKVGADDH
ncbi:hypothetical protein B0H15DRAFT_939266 [Mycena belliarum]|uniref:Uncharacterized protein n=1 Tax=Mycena belliarum TaxID=1033014 RepID=A0AAD6U391_9AGAR|nr:hypothetical protein B0H15DRAFT_939266 [Mycena belliae]